MIKLCTPKTSKPSVALDALVDRIVLLAGAIAEKNLFAYQKEFATRLVEAILLHDGDMVTGLWSRQAGKSECIAAVIAACCMILPSLANSPLFEDDWRFNCTDDQGNYRGYKRGLMVGIYAPKQEQADIAFTRLKDILENDTAIAVSQELGIHIEISNSNKLWMSNGSKVRSQSASEQSKIEGESYHWLFLDEAQDIGMTKVRKSLHPMVAAYNGVIVKIGTCGIEKSDFYTAIKTNKRNFAMGKPRNHYEYNYKICQQYNSMYKKFIETEKQRLDENSDEFRLSYTCEWLLERGQFITEEHLINPKIAMVSGGFHKIYQAFPARFTVVAGIDFGKLHDPTVVTVAYVDWINPIADEWIDTPEDMIHFTAFQKHIIGWKMILGDNYESQFHQITEYLSHFKGLRKICVDATGVGQWGLDRLKVHYDNFDRGKTVDNQNNFGSVEVEGLVFTPQSKSDGFKLLHSDLLTGRMTYPAGVEAKKDRMLHRFIQEMLDLRKTYKNGYMCCAAPEEPGAHDDFPVSAMICNWAAQTPAYLGTVEVENGNYLMGRT